MIEVLSEEMVKSLSETEMSTYGISLAETKKQLQRLTQGAVPFVIWCYWNGEKMSDNRVHGFNIMLDHIGVPVCMLTPDNLQELISPNVPLHPAFQSLNALHKSDYLRAYLLHHWGGGYRDIKPTKVNWSSVWKEFDDPNVYLVGQPEIESGPARVFDDEGNWMPDHWRDLISMGGFVGRPGTDLSFELLERLNAILDEHHEQLEKNPARHAFEHKRKKLNLRPWLRMGMSLLAEGKQKYPNVPYGLLLKDWLGQLKYLPVKEGYPFRWSLIGEILHPLVYKYRNHIRQTLPFDPIGENGLPLGLPYR